MSIQEKELNLKFSTIGCCKICGEEKNNINTHIFHQHIKKDNKVKSYQDYYHKYVLCSEIKPVCSTCGKEVKFISITKGYQRVCSHKCAMNNNEIKSFVQRRAKEGLIEKFGVINVSQIPGSREKMKQTKLEHFGDPNFNNSKKSQETNLRKYGSISYTGTEEYNEKVKETSQKKYGVDHFSSSKEIRRKVKETTMKNGGYTFQRKVLKERIKNIMIERYGASTSYASPILKEKILKTCLERYGFTSPMKNQNTLLKTKITKLLRYGDSGYNNRKKCRETNMKKYGVKNVSMHPEIFKRAQINNKQGREHVKILNINNCYIDCVNNSEELFVKICNQNNILVEQGEFIDYFSPIDNKSHRYFCDFKIKEKDSKWRLIELKGFHRWFQKDLDSGLAELKCKVAEEFSVKEGYHDFKILLVNQLNKFRKRINMPTFSHLNYCAKIRDFLFDENIDKSILLIMNKNTKKIIDEFDNLILNNSFGLELDTIFAQDTKEVRDINEWEVLTPNGWSNFKQVKKITKEYSYKITLDDKTTLVGSPYHKIKLQNNEFVFLNQLTKGDKIHDGRVIVKKRKINKKIDLYDLLEVEKNNEYYTNGIVSHNCASITKLDEIWSAAGPTLSRSNGSCIGVSTPKGQSGWYFDRYTNASNEGWNIINAHWSLHPIFSKGMYMYVATGEEQKLQDTIDMYKIVPKSRVKYDSGSIVFFSTEWPDTKHPDDALKYKTKQTYKYKTDGKLRSPWYDIESAKLGKEKTKCELDCSFAGSGGEVLDTELVKILELKAKNYKILNAPKKDNWRSYKKYFEYDPTHKYILCADVATGDGSDYSAFIVFDLTSFRIVCTFKDQIKTNEYAEIIAAVGKEYGTCEAIVEANNPGLSVLTELKVHIKYPKIFYSTMKKSDPTSNTNEKVRKMGFWQSNETRNMGGEKLEEKIEKNEIEIPSIDLVNEFYTWIWKDGRRDHLAGKHDDLIIALTIAMYVICYVNIARDLRKQSVQIGMSEIEVIRNEGVSHKVKQRIKI